MQLPKTIELRGLRLITTKQLAEAYETDERKLQYNFRYNKDKYKEGKHYIEVAGEELSRLKSRSEFQSLLKQAKHINLWTEKGALLHAKSLNTDKAWEVYDYLVDFYFRAKEVKKEEPISLKKAEETFDIAPYFRKVVERLPIEALDAMERSFRTGNSKPIKTATLDILAEKMKRSIT